VPKGIVKLVTFRGKSRPTCTRVKIQFEGPGARYTAKASTLEVSSGGSQESSPPQKPGRRSSSTMLAFSTSTVGMSAGLGVTVKVSVVPVAVVVDPVAVEVVAVDVVELVAVSVVVVVMVKSNTLHLLLPASSTSM